MKIIWQVDPEDIIKVNEFYSHHSQNAFVKMRIASNLNDVKTPISKKAFWERMIGCLLTAQQRSGPTSAVNRFLSTQPFLLRHEICQTQAELDQFVTKTLSEFGGLRRSTGIGKEALHNSK
ncbi:MAG TPA: hypothetical protein VGM76_12215, partial [Lacipirellulaceae bacterium]